jgi:NAD(P)-dependent dehydrogenase (short-subunit alcohol dehydrogenase family)
MLNSVAKNLSIDLAGKGVTVAVFHPGWVQTDMGGAGATLTIPEATDAIANTLSGLTPRDNGKFFNYDGTDLPW